MKNYEFLILRETFLWGSRGKNGDEPLKYIILKDIDDEHLVNIIIWINKYKSSYNDETHEIMKMEYEYRIKLKRKNKLKILNSKI